MKPNAPKKSLRMDLLYYEDRDLMLKEEIEILKQRLKDNRSTIKYLQKELTKLLKTNA